MFYTAYKGIYLSISEQAFLTIMRVILVHTFKVDISDSEDGSYYRYIDSIGEVYIICVTNFCRYLEIVLTT